MSQTIAAHAVTLSPRSRARVAGENRAKLERIVSKALDKMDELLDIGEPTEQAMAAGVLLRCWAASSSRPGSEEPEDLDYTDRGRRLLAEPPPGLAAMLAEAGWRRDV